VHRQNAVATALWIAELVNKEPKRCRAWLATALLKLAACKPWQHPPLLAECSQLSTPSNTGRKKRVAFESAGSRV